ncbi:MAG: hypothetical protein H0U67_16755 [Gemmatimonadetes bacterium]|nr:hypothetical protein [Gemmatimonadota bacterium]
MRLTMLARNTSGLRAKLEARTARQKARQLKAAQDAGEEEHAVVVSLANRDTGYMASRTRLEFTRGGYNYAVGYRAEDFIGQTNPVTGRPITSFYPVYVIQGTRRYAGNDFLSAARRIMRPRVLRRYSDALSGR